MGRLPALWLWRLRRVRLGSRRPWSRPRTGPWLRNLRVWPWWAWLWVGWSWRRLGIEFLVLRSVSLRLGIRKLRQSLLQRFHAGRRSAGRRLLAADQYVVGAPRTVSDRPGDFSLRSGAGGVQEWRLHRGARPHQPGAAAVAQRSGTA